MYEAAEAIGQALLEAGKAKDATPKPFTPEELETLFPSVCHSRTRHMDILTIADSTSTSWTGMAAAAGIAHEGSAGNRCTPRQTCSRA
jgi:hypothetical protein